MNEIRLYNINTITNSFFKKGKIEELDFVKEDIDKMNSLFYDLSLALSQEIEKNINLIKLDKTDKDGYFLSLTKKGEKF